MRTQEEREEQTLIIATALGLFVLVVVITFGVLAILSSVVDVSDGLAGTVLTVATLAAGTLAFIKLVRASKR